MNVEWFLNKKEMIATIYETNITFNTSAANHFKDSFSTIVGFDVKNNYLLVKPVTKKEVDDRNLRDDELHPMSIKPSYGRINGKQLIKTLCYYYPIDFNNKKAHKYYCNWSTDENLLKIFLEREVE